MRKKINQLFLVAALMCGAISMTSCQGLIDAIVGSTDNPSEVKVDVDKLTPEQIAQAVKLLEDVQKEGAQLTVSFTYKTVDYDATFEKKGDDYELLSFMSGGSPASVDFKPYLTLTIPEDWTEEDIDNYIVVPEKDDGLIVDEDEDEGDEDDGEDDGDDEGDDDEGDGDDDEGDDDDGEAESGNDEGGIHLTRGTVEIPALDFVFGLEQSEDDDLVQAQICTKEATATLVGDYENFNVKNLTMPSSGSAASTRAAQVLTVYLVQKPKGKDKKDYKIKKVTVDPEIKELQCQQSVTLTAAYEPETAKIYEVQWKTSNANVFSIQPLSTFTAQVTALAAGKATIYAFINGKNKKFTIKVPEVPVESLTLNEEEAEVAIDPNTKDNGYLQLQATIFPDYATKKALKWTSSDTKIAKVDKNGLVTVKNKRGNNVDKEVTITCTPKNKNDRDKSATCKINVVAVEGFAFVDEVKLNSGELTLTEGDEATLEATLEPGDATNQELTWTSSKPAVATVDQNGKVTALKAGKTTIKVKALGSKGAKKTANCKVTVNKLSDPIVGPSGGFDNGGDPTL